MAARTERRGWHQRTGVDAAANQALDRLELMNAADHEVWLNFLGDQPLQVLFDEDGGASVTISL